MIKLKNYLEPLSSHEQIKAILEYDDQNNNGIMAFIKKGISAGQNGKNIMFLLNFLPDDMNILIQALTSLNTDNKSALFMAFEHNQVSMQHGLFEKIRMKTEGAVNFSMLLKIKDNRGFNFVFRAIYDDLKSFFDPIRYGLRILRVEPSLLKDLFLEMETLTLNNGKTIKMNALTLAIMYKKNDIIKLINDLFCDLPSDLPLRKDNLHVWKNIILHRDSNGQNPLMCAAAMKSPDAIIQIFLNVIDHYEELTTALFIFDTSGDFSAISSAIKNENKIFLIRAFKALHCLAQGNNIEFDKVLSVLDIFNVIKLLLMESKVDWCKQQAIPASFLLLQPHGFSQEKFSTILTPFYQWCISNKTTLNNLNQLELFNILKDSDLESLPSELILKLITLKKSLVKLKKKLFSLKENLDALKNSLAL